jgi:hypothetical protein
MAGTKRKKTQQQATKARIAPPQKIYLPECAPRSIKQKDVRKIYAGFKNKRTGAQLYQGRLCFFFNMSPKFGNKIADDGFICSVGEKNQLVPRNVRQPFIACVFARAKAGQPFLYLGDVSSIIREDNNRNKMLWG